MGHKYRMEHLLDKNYSYLLMPRPVWEEMKPRGIVEAEIDLAGTPLSSVARDACFVSALAVGSSNSGYEVQVFRSDPKDEPTPYNVDVYHVEENIRSRCDYLDLVNQASTSDTPALQAQLDNTVAWVRERPGNGHWRDFGGLPQLVQVRILSRST